MRGRLGPNVVGSMVSVGSTVAAALVSVPLILAKIGTAGYGVWTIAMTVVLYLTIADTGFSPAVQRFVAAAHGRSAFELTRRLLWTSLAIYVAIGTLLLAALELSAHALTGAFHVPTGLRTDAVTLFELLGPLILLALVVNAIGNVLQGLQRFLAFGWTAGAGAIGYLVALVILLEAGAGLVGVGVAAVIQQALVAVLRLVAARDVILGSPPALLRRTELRELFGFSARLQMSVLAALINVQSDRLIVGLVASTVTVGQLGIGSQVADAGRLLALAAFSPIVSSLSFAVAAGDQGVRAHFVRVNRLWTVTTIGATAVGVGAVDPVITAWLGPGHGQAALFGAMLIAAYGIGLLTATGVAYLRAIGAPGLEARLAAVIIGLNVAFTIPLALIVGAVGVVAGTVGAYVLGTAYFFIAVRRMATMPPRPLRALGRPLVASLAAGVAAFGWSTAMAAWLPTGPALVPVGLGCLAVMVTYLSYAVGVRPTPAHVRDLLAGMRAQSPDPVFGSDRL